MACAHGVPGLCPPMPAASKADLARDPSPLCPTGSTGAGDEAPGTQ